MDELHQRFSAELPHLTPDNYRVTSPASWEYNCIGWAAGSPKAWWWPAPNRYWPVAAPQEETLEAFSAALATVGYAPCLNDQLEEGIEKVVLYVRNGVPTHAARQLATGRWTSKLGPQVDIEDPTPDIVAGGTYGQAALVLGRPRPATIHPGTA